MSALELWGGAEATVNRIGDVFHNQLVRSRHWERLEDLDRFAAMGLSALRHPLLWELVAPDGFEHPNWTWFDQRFERLRELGLRPIAGLVHHGSGPRSTSLVSDTFAPGLETFARLAAERYPWVDDWTPINEPLTTARFSALYGVWYPHARDDASFCKAIVNECRAIVLAMRQIRAVNPKARLVQTEDLGFVSATPALAEQALFENTRRWLSFDLLCGKVDPRHPFWTWLQRGVPEAQLEFFLENPCPPDVMGLNYYITSDRTLDEHLERWGPEYHGGNGRQRYADVESVRGEFGITGHESILRQAWKRFGLPLALTEVQLDCTREEQLRWAHQAWQAALAVRRDGVDVRAVTLWSLLGAYDWNSLLTRADHYYEPGAYDLRGPEPRPTALVRMAKALATTGHFEHPALDGPGWWHRDERAFHNRRGHAARLRHSRRFGAHGSRPLLITGATGTLGQAFAHACELRGLSYRLLSRKDMDIADERSVGRALDRFDPWALINTAGYVRVRDAERDPHRCHRENTRGPTVLAEAAEQRGLPFVTFSSDLVFDGARGRPYVESDPVSPLTVYGSTKAEAEERVLRACERVLLVRTSAFFSPWDVHNFVHKTAESLRRQVPVKVTLGEQVSPTYLPDLVRVTLDLLIDEAWGVWHLANDGVISWRELGQWVAHGLRLPRLFVDEPPWIPPAQPRLLGLKSERAALMPKLDSALERYLDEVRENV